MSKSVAARCSSRLKAQEIRRKRGKDIEGDEDEEGENEGSAAEESTTMTIQKSTTTTTSTTSKTISKNEEDATCCVCTVNEPGAKIRRCGHTVTYVSATYPPQMSSRLLLAFILLASLTLTGSFQRITVEPRFGRFGSQPQLRSALLASPLTDPNQIHLFHSILPQVLTSSLVYSSLTFYFDRPRGEMLIADDAVAKRPSKIPNAGLGLFATKDLPAGTNLGLYPGVLTPTNAYRNKKLQTHPNSVAYVWKLQNSPGSLSERGVLDPTDSSGDISDYCSGGSDTIPLSRFLFSTLFSGFKKSTILCRINEPTTPEEANVDSTEETEAGKVLFFLSNDVAAGEELYLYYGEYYDRSGYS